jgi:hypothetical protein
VLSAGLGNGSNCAAEGHSDISVSTRLDMLSYMNHWELYVTWTIRVLFPVTLDTVVFSILSGSELGFTQEHILYMTRDPFPG